MDTSSNIHIKVACSEVAWSVRALLLQYFFIYWCCADSPSDSSCSDQGSSLKTLNRSTACSRDSSTVVWCCVVLCGVVWCCVVLCGVVWCCMVLCGVVLCGAV